MNQTLTTDLWGQDIALDKNGQALVAANGELVLTEGVDTGVQDIKIRLVQRLGELFYDSDFGSLIYDWVYEENTPENRVAACAEIVMRVELDPRVKALTVKASVLMWNEKEFICSISWRFIDKDQPFNLVMQLNKETKELIIKDEKANPDSFSAHISDY